MTALPQAYRVRRLSTASAAATVVVSVVALGAYALRVRELGMQSFWFDEAMSVVIAAKSPAELLALLISEDIHPPLYPLLLHFWMALAGNGEFSARYLSVFSGVALVPLFYVTGNRLAIVSGMGKPSSFSLLGSVGALLAASSAFYVGYSQETRNYMLVTLLGLLSSYALLRSLENDRRGDWAAYGIATSAALYTNYTAFMLVAFHGLFMLLVQGRHRDTLRRWTLTTGLVALSYLPWLGYTIEQLSRINDYWPGTLQLETAMKNTFTQLVAGSGASAPTVVVPIALAVGLLVLGLAALAFGIRGRFRAPHSLFLLLYLVLPSVILFAIAYSRPKFDPRYLLVATPAFYLILAWGISALLGAARTRAPFFLRLVMPLLGALTLVTIVAVSTVYGEPTRVKADYRSLITFMESRAQPGDALVVLMNAPHPYIYYGQSGMPWYPMERVDDFGGAIQRLNKLSEHHRRLWFLLWQNEWEDPANYVIHAMEDQATEVPLQKKFTGLNLRLFEVSPTRPFSVYGSSIQHPIEATFGGDLEFWGWNASPSRMDKEGNWSVEVPSGATLKVDIHWIAQTKQRTDLKVNLTLVDADRHVWVRTDEFLGNPLFAPSKWKVGEIIHDLHDLKIPAGTPPGEYAVEMNLYDPVTLKPVDITLASGAGIGAALRLGKVTVGPSAVRAWSPVNKPAVFTWEIASDVLEMHEAELGQPAAVPGEAIEGIVDWAAPRGLSSDYSVRLELVDEGGKTIREQLVPISGRYPVGQWRTGEIVRGRYWIPLPVDLAKGRYWVLATPVPQGSESDRNLGRAQISHVDVVAPKVSYEVPPVQNRVSARLGGNAELLGYDLSNTTTRPGGTLSLTLYWRATGLFDRGYKVFNHVIDDSNRFAGQRDAVPMGDTRPTTTWRMGEVLADRYEIPILQDAIPGSYHLKVGMYPQDGGERLSISGPDGAPLGDSLTLATIEVAP